MKLKNISMNKVNNHFNLPNEFNNQNLLVKNSNGIIIIPLIIMMIFLRILIFRNLKMLNRILFLNNHIKMKQIIKIIRCKKIVFLYNKNCRKKIYQKQFIKMKIINKTIFNHLLKIKILIKNHLYGMILNNKEINQFQNIVKILLKIKKIMFKPTITCGKIKNLNGMMI